MDNEHQPTDTAPATTSTFWKNVGKEILLFIIIAGGIILPFRMYIAEPYIVSGDSMDPTFATGDYLIVDKLSYERGDPQRGSVVIFKIPTTTLTAGESGRNLIKRVIGLPGDTLQMTGNTITIKNAEHPNGFALDQSYIAYPLPGSFTITLGADEYFVMGDNRPVSWDSRSWGVLPRANIIGKPIARLYPFSEITLKPGDHTVR